MSMNPSRRSVMKGATAAALAVSMPRIGAAQSSKVLKFVPQTALTSLDPTIPSAAVTRTHGYVIFDTLFGLDDNYRPQPQMLEGHLVEQDGLLWKLTLREGLKFHDNERVLARDAVASIKRWSVRNSFGQTLMALTDELSAPTDNVIEFRLKRPFSMLPDALAKTFDSFPGIMPARLASEDPFRPVSELVGSGPFRFRADEHVMGSRVVYDKFEDYLPRADAKISFTAGPKIANFDRVEWQVVPDPSTVLAALQLGEVDWWDSVPTNLEPALLGSSAVKTAILDKTGEVVVIRFNQLYPPFSNPEIRRAMLGAVSQKDFILSVSDPDPSRWKADVGIFCPGTPMANDAGIKQTFGTPRNLEKVQQQIAAAGYKGEPVVVLDAIDSPEGHVLSEIGADLLHKVGFNVDHQLLDIGSYLARRNVRAAPEHGGWNMFVIRLSAAQTSNPVTHQALRGNGDKAWFGWPTAPELERLRSAWINAPDEAARLQLAREIQLQAWNDVPYIPAGQYTKTTGFRSNLRDMRSGFPQFYNVRKS